MLFYLLLLFTYCLIIIYLPLICNYRGKGLFSKQVFEIINKKFQNNEKSKYYNELKHDHT